MRWIVRPGDGLTVGDVLARAGADAEAVTEGRVFVGRRRVRAATEAVEAGDVVDVATARVDPLATAEPTVLVHAGDFVAVDKPAGVPTIADHGGSAHALVALVAARIGVEEARLHPTSRLDRDVSGVVILALTNAAAERLAGARERGAYERRYVAIASRAPAVERGVWDQAVGRAADPRRRRVGGRDAVPAKTLFAVCARVETGAAMLGVAPVTGRTHQIRVHASNAGAPLVGDRDYGGPGRMTLAGGRVVALRRIALHAARVVVPGADGAPVVAEAPVPRELTELWAALGGEPSAWNLAASCALSSPPPPP